MLAYLFGTNDKSRIAQPNARGKNNTQTNRDCANFMSQEPGIYQLENFHNRGVNPQSSCLPGFYTKDGFGLPQSATDVSSRLRHEQKLTNLREINQFGALPMLSIPDVSKGCQNVDIETALIQGQITYKDNANIPRESNFYNRSFQIFDKLNYNPNDYAVEPFRLGGTPTRFDNQRRQGGNRGTKA